MNLLSVAPKLTPYECYLIRLLTEAHADSKRLKSYDGRVKGTTASPADVALYEKQQVIEAIEFWVRMGAPIVEEREALLKKLK